jgi:hypothetical protein
MIAGHFGFAAAVKAREPEAPLWALMLATQWLDVVFVPLFLAHIETLEPLGKGGYGQAIIHANYTHSLLGAALLAIVFGAFFAWRWGRRLGLMLAAVVFSHWLLDLLVHRPDLPLLPGGGGGVRLGIGLWRTPAAAAATELGLVLLGAWLYWRATLRLTPPPSNRRPAHLAAGVLLASGLLTLGLDLAGL